MILNGKNQEDALSLTSMKMNTLRLMAATHLQSEEYENVLKCVRVLKEAAVGTGGEHPSVPFIALQAWLGLGKVVEAEVELKNMVDNSEYPVEVCVSAVEVFFQAGGKKRLEAAKSVFLGLLGRCMVSAGAAVRVVERVMEQERRVSEEYILEAEKVFSQLKNIPWFIFCRLQLRKFTMFYLLKLEANISCAFLKDLFIAGTDTTYATIIWAMTELMRNPRTMKKAQDEVRRVIGKKEKIEESDLHQLHFLKLVIKEVFRLHPPAPLPIARESINQWSIDGYEILPKTRVFVNAWAIGRDPQTWENPEEFWPERFMNSSIDFRGGHNFELIPFGAGRRGCPAVSFATMMLEHALANLLHSFDWDLPSGMSRKDLDMIEEPGLTVYKKFPLFLVPRFHNHM